MFLTKTMIRLLLLGWILAVIPAVAQDDARQWEGIYEPLGNTSREYRKIFLSDCDQESCHLGYEQQGWHSCSYYTAAPNEAGTPGMPLRIQGNQGYHRFVEELEPEYHETLGERWVCELQVRLQQDGLDRQVIITEAGPACTQIAPCGARAGISVDEPFYNVRSRPSFDCRQARSPMENLICSEVTLGVLDVELGDIYRTLYQGFAEDAPALRRSQLDWMRQQRDTCVQQEDPLVCTQAAYQQRIAALGLMDTYLELMQAAPLPAMPTFARASGFAEIIDSDVYWAWLDWSDYPRFQRFMRWVGVPDYLFELITRPNQWMDGIGIMEGQQLLRGERHGHLLIVGVSEESGLWIFDGYQTGSSSVLRYDPDKSVFFSSQGVGWDKAPQDWLAATGWYHETPPGMLSPQQPLHLATGEGVCFWGDYLLTGLVQPDETIHLPASMLADIQQRLDQPACHPFRR